MTIQPATVDTKFEPVPNWGALPMGITFRGDATSVAVDSKDNVYVFNRGNNPIAVDTLQRLSAYERLSPERRARIDAL